MSLPSTSPGDGWTVLSTCSDGACPTVFEAENGDIVVQGLPESIVVPEGEQAVRIPLSVFLQALERVQSVE